MYLAQVSTGTEMKMKTSYNLSSSSSSLDCVVVIGEDVAFSLSFSELLTAA